MLQKTPAERPTAAEVRQAMQRIALEILDDSVEFESYEIATEAVGDDSGRHGEDRGNPQVRWTPEISMVDGSGYLLVRPQGGWQQGSRDLKRGD